MTCQHSRTDETIEKTQKQSFTVELSDFFRIAQDSVKFPTALLEEASISGNPRIVAFTVERLSSTACNADANYACKADAN